jgi:hypothetical protein
MATHLTQLRKDFDAAGVAESAYLTRRQSKKSENFGKPMRPSLTVFVRREYGGKLKA